LLFQSFQFAAFLLCILCIFFFVPARGRIYVLAVANLVFFMAADPSAIIWLAFSVVSTHVCACLVEKTESGWKKKAMVLSVLLLNLLLLAVFRYLPVWETLLNAAYGRGLRRFKFNLAGNWGLVAPLGISFYTLQALGYLLDVSAKKYPAEKNLLRYTVFVTFFPNITSGPIERGGHFLPQLKRIGNQSRRQLLDYDRIVQGAISMLWGFFLKMVVADRVSILVDYLYGIYENTDSFTMMMAAVFYSVQIYCDFASYSCIASGAAKIMGFELLPNFRQPYFAAGIRSFWDRWHMSLSGWFKDYVYIPLGGSRKGFLRRNLNVLFTFLVSGLWHGGAPQYLMWGLLHGSFQVLENCIEKLSGKWKIGGVHKWPAAVSFIWKGVHGLLTFAAVSCLWIFFRAESVKVALVCLKNLFTKWQGFLYVKEFIFAMGLNKVEMFVAAVAVMIILFVDMISEWKKKEFAHWLYEAPYWFRAAFCMGLIAMIFVCGKYGVGYDPADFIYMQF